jgi:SAM-dependent methyltransferase
MDPSKPEKIISLPHHNNFFLHILGVIVLMINKVRYSILGYHQPRDFSSTQIKKSVEYDLSVVRSWIKHLTSYTQDHYSLKDKTVLELGPGPDLGIGLTLLSQGVKTYTALDKNYLIKTTPAEFYTELFNHLSTLPEVGNQVPILKQQLATTLQGKNDRLNYIVDSNFSMKKIPEHSIDIVFSQAAFEHFDDSYKTIQDLNAVVHPGTLFIAEVGPLTHTRWLIDHDPQNIYRFSNAFYKACTFSGIPNRVRPYQFIEALEQAGWTNIQVLPLKVLDEQSTTRLLPHLNKQFQDPKNQMEILTFMLCATKK